MKDTQTTKRNGTETASPAIKVLQTHAHHKEMSQRAHMNINGLSRETRVWSR